MSSNPTNEDVNRVRSWLGAHVEARALHTAVELHLLSSLLDGPKNSAELVERYNYDPYSTRVIMDILATLGIVIKGADGRYELVDTFMTAFTQETEAELIDSLGGWQRLTEFSASAYAELLTSAQNLPADANSGQTQLLEYAWKYVWSVGIMESGKHGLFSSLDERPRSLAELAAQSQLSEAALIQLCMADQHTGLLSLSGDVVELTQEARLAFGKGSMKEYCRWMEQRLMMEHEYFFSPLGMLSDCVRNRQPASLSSSLGSPTNGQFRRTFVRINRPLIPLLYRVAQKVTQAMDGMQKPIRVLEIGAGLGCWGIALAATSQNSRIVAVDTPDALGETQRVVAAAKVSGQYTWMPGDMQYIKHEGDKYDVIVLNEICHTVSPTSLASWLEHIVQQLSPDGTLLIADMVLDENDASPARHLLSAVKLFVTGGGQVLNITDYQQLLQRLGLNSLHLHRLATTDLLVATPRQSSSLAL